MTTTSIPWVKVAIAAAVAAGTTIWGWFGWLLLIWVACMAIDYISGSVAAMKAHEWSSDQAREGLYHKGGQLLAVVVAGMLDIIVGLILTATSIRLPFSYSVLFAPLVVVWYSLTELGSIAENAHKLGAQLPSWLLKALKIAKNATDQAGEDVAGKDE